MNNYNKTNQTRIDKQRNNKKLKNVILTAIPKAKFIYCLSLSSPPSLLTSHNSSLILQLTRKKRFVEITNLTHIHKVIPILTSNEAVGAVFVFV